jgi:copper transport protein
VRRLLAVLVVVALAAPAEASAHARLLATTPSDGAVLARSPHAVRIVFDDTIHAGSGDAAVANTTNVSVLAGPVRAHGRELTIPLRARLPNGDYTVRWSIVSQDGHREVGVLAFAVGSASPVPHAVLTASAPLAWSDVLFRTLYYLGLLGGAGAAIFGLLARSVPGDRLRRPLAHLLFLALLLTFLGGSGLVRSVPDGTRFAIVLQAALVVAVIGGAAAALAPMYPILLRVAGAAALALLAAPTLAGHVLDRDQPRWLSVPADLAHTGAASVWLGGLIALVYVLPRATTDAAQRTAVARRFSSVALIAVVLLGLTGLTRAVTELRAVGQLWSTSYGAMLIVKTGLFVPLVGLGWLNRTQLIESFGRLRRSAFVEVALLGTVVVVVAVLTQLRPGVAASRTGGAATAPPTAQPPTLPPRYAVVLARELGAIAVAVGRTPTATAVTLVGPEGTGLDGRDVRIDGRDAVSCGAGCYRGSAGPGPVVVTFGGSRLRFDLPERAPDAATLLARVTRAYRASRTVVFDESLRSRPSNGEVTRFELVAPNRLVYRTRGGPQAVVIGARRWDRESPTGRWIPSQQTPLDVPQPYWTKPTNVHLVGPNTVTFLDRSIPAWFTVTLDARHRLPARVAMTAASHFMVDRYESYDVPVDVSPPSR